MATSVKLAAEDKAKLERLQALITLKGGGKVAQQELLATLISDAWARGDEFVETMFKTKMPMTDEQFEKVLALVEDWGVETHWEKMDRRLYADTDRIGGTERGKRLRRR